MTRACLIIATEALSRQRVVPQLYASSETLDSLMSHDSASGSSPQVRTGAHRHVLDIVDATCGQSSSISGCVSAIVAGRTAATAMPLSLTRATLRYSIGPYGVHDRCLTNRWSCTATAYDPVSHDLILSRR